MPALMDMVACLSATTGTGPVTLGAAIEGHRTFAQATGGLDRLGVSYSIVEGNKFETGIGRYDGINNRLERQVVEASSNGGALIELAGGSVVSVTFLSSDNVADWPSFSVSASSASTPPTHEFRTVPFVGGTVENDRYGGFSTSSSIYVIPVTGTYVSDLAVRLRDGTPASRTFGMGVDILNRDSPVFHWRGTIGVNRHTFSYTLQLPYQKGDQIRPFIYVEDDGMTLDGRRFSTRMERRG